jgi:hypothetical protein
MGVLDDAIRAHLELRRQHGAAEDDLARQEREALGPIRREAAEPANGDEPSAEEALAEDAAGEAPEAIAPPVEPRPAPEVPYTPERDVPPEPEPEPDLPPDVPPTEPDDDARAAVDTPTEAFDALDADESDTDGEDEDVLEETPEFLQDTPEHDRLWFEQKPPRDFDFEE